MHSLYNQVRVAAAIARGPADADRRQRPRTPPPSQTPSSDGVITAPDGRARQLRLAHRRAAAAKTHAGGLAQLKPASQQHAGRAPRSGGSTRSTSSPAASSSRWTSTCPARCRRWSAGRRRSTARRSAVQNAAQVKAMPGVTDVAIIPHTQSWPAASRCAPRRSGSASTPSARCRSTGRPGSADGKSDADVLADLKAAELPMTPALRTGARPALHVLLPARRPAGDQLRGRRRPPRQRRDLVEPEVADLGQGAARGDPRAAAWAA